MSNSDDEMISQKILAPLEQQTLQFYGKPIIVVRLPDDRPAVVFNFLCNNLQIEPHAQVRRIHRTEAITDDLVYVLVDRKLEEGGPQPMAALILHAVPFWLAGIDVKRVKEEIRPDLIRYQREVVDVLYAWAQTQKTLPAPTNLVPSEPITQPTRPEQGASLEVWREYHLQMAEVIRWQLDIEQWRGSVESRLEGVEAMTGLIPEILDRLGPATLIPEHQRKVQVYVKQLSQASGKHRATIYDDLKTAFGKPRYQDLLEDEWPR
ncbi:MAG TPA: phage antirepressor N-terminal domain-containing protein [Ktedonobacteraceae bacterium]|nr:phage antirepressor N-terminal domain-containing protein [Ktedonobacteraceae bacterium]